MKSEKWFLDQRIRKRNRADETEEEVGRTITIMPDKEKILFALEHYFGRLDAIYEIIDLRKEIEELSKKIPIKKNSPVTKETSIAFNQLRTWPQRIIFMLKRNRKPMNRKEIITEVIALLPDIEYRWRNPQKEISSILSDAIKNGKLKRVRGKGTTGYYYGLPAWFDANETLLPKFSLYGRP